MSNKKQLQDRLKQQYGINKNISQDLSPVNCEQILSLLEAETSVQELVDALINKNTELSNNNRHYGTLRSNAEKQLRKTQAEYEKLQQSIAEAESRNDGLRAKRGDLDKEQVALQKQIDNLKAQNKKLSGTVQTLERKTETLTDVNEELKRDNKALKNLVDQIRLKLAIDIKRLMRYEDSEIRKAAARLFKWTQG